MRLLNIHIDVTDDTVEMVIVMPDTGHRRGLSVPRLDGAEAVYAHLVRVFTATIATPAVLSAIAISNPTAA
jgi:hypothetical protein